jgi:hypothetical protein
MMIDRRDLIQRAAMLLGGAISSSAVAGVLAGCVSTPPGAGQKQTFLTAGETAAVAAISEHIIPRTDTPGAIDVGVPGFIDKMMAGFYQDRQRAILRAGLVRIDQEARAGHGTTFAVLTPDQQMALLKVYDREAYEQSRRNANTPDADPHFFRILKELTIVGFCTSEPGATKFLKYAPVPGPYRGDIPYSEVGKAWQS